MRSFKIYGRSAACWVDCELQEDAIRDSRPKDSDSHTGDELIDRGNRCTYRFEETVNSIPALTGR